MFFLKKGKKISLVGYSQEFAGSSDSCQLSDSHCLIIKIIVDKGNVTPLGSAAVNSDPNRNSIV
jgi:hypothetical protein